MRIILAGGGTGGHLFPGLAVAEELRRRDPQVRILLLCTDRDEVYEGIRELGLETEVLPSTNRGSLPRRVLALLPALVRAMRVLKRFQPDIVVGLGGYGSVAPVACAASRRVPSILLEQNVVPGKSNRFLSRFADEVACQWEESRSCFPRRARLRVTGNPIRSSIQRQERTKVAAELGLDPASPTLLVMGGSQGATPLNGLILEALPVLAHERVRIQFVHLSGRDDRERVQAAYEQHGFRARAFGFLEDMSLVYSVCDLAFSRAGGTSIAELAALGIPSVLVPYPYATDNHQHLNAGVLARRGAAVLLEQATLSPHRLAHLVANLLGDRERLAAMGRQSQLAGVPRAAGVVADRIEALANGRHREGIAAERGVRVSGGIQRQ
jgi:UDP-N-acetylglucosamine--N-acetylmuramyl-(pentapeptide) pyrophosphoryl-undecaprenol N-acetylglucosamine transferase